MKQHRIIIALALAAASLLSAEAQSVLQVRDTITDPSFVYPESYEAGTHKLLQDWYLQNYIALDRSDSPKADVYTSDEDYIKRLKAMPTEIEMPFNSIVKGCIEMYVDRKRSLIERMLGMSTYYMPIFEEALEAEGMPLELKYLPIIESALNPDAVSRAGAAGLWQFMPATARGLGLEINSLVDERRDPVKSSKMAARYLHQLHDIYGDWSLAIAAYNCGPGNVNKALRRAGEGKKDFWEIYPYLKRETRGYLPGFIAANYAMNYYDRHDISPALARRPIITDSVHVKKRVHFQQIADVLNIPIEEIRILNPQYRKDIIPGDIKPYALILPSQQVLSYIVSEDSIVAHNAHLYARRDVVEPSDGATRISDDGNYIITEVVKYHKVRRGETFSSLARRYGVTIGSIKRVNGIRTLKAGRTIKIVTTKRTPRPVEEPITQPVDSVSIDVNEEVIPVTFDENAPTDSIAAPQPLTDDRNEIIEDDPDDATTDNSATDDNLSAAETSEAAGNTPSGNPLQAGRNAQANEPIDSETPQASSQDTRTEESAVTSDESSEANRQVKDRFNNPERKPAADKPVYHKVRRGQNLSKIARQHGTTVRRIEQLNPGINPSKIQVGQRIRVK